MLISILVIAFSWGIAQVLVKKGLKYLSPWQSYAVDTFLAVLIWIPFAFIKGVSLNSIDALAIFIVLFLGASYGFYYYVVEKGPLSIISPVVNSSPIITVILSVIFLKETLTVWQAAAIFITMFGVLILSLSPAESGRKSGFWLILAVILSLVWGIEGAVTKFMVEKTGTGTYMMLLAIGQIAATSLWYIFRRPKKIIPALPKKYFLPTVTGVILFNIGMIAFVTAIENHPASLISPLSNSFILITVVFSVLYLKEKIRPFQVIGIILTLLGLILVNIQPLEIPSKPVSNIPAQDLKPKEAIISTIFPKPSQTEIKTENIKLTIVKVKKVIDGDTIDLTNGDRVRYIGMDTPEITNDKNVPDCFATEALIINRELVENQSVGLEKDVSKKDKYGRLLRYVWLDGVLINRFLVEQGYGRIFTLAPDIKYANLILQAEKEAREANRGLWDKCAN